MHPEEKETVEKIIKSFDVPGEWVRSEKSYVLLHKNGKIYISRDSYHYGSHYFIHIEGINGSIGIHPPDDIHPPSDQSEIRQYEIACNKRIKEMYDQVVTKSMEEEKKRKRTQIIKAVDKLL